MALTGLTLAMDASAGDGTIAVLRDGTVLAEARVVMRSEREERFFPAVLETLQRAGTELAQLHRVVVGAGPGSFTALRVVGAIAKGLCQARALPLFGVPSLALMDLEAEAPLSAARVVATLDALRGERYAALLTRSADGALQGYESLGLIPTAELAVRAAALDALLIGPDESQRAHPHARVVAACADYLAGAAPVALATWEPTYGRLAEAQVKWEAAHGRALR